MQTETSTFCAPGEQGPNEEAMDVDVEPEAKLVCDAAEGSTYFPFVAAQRARVRAAGSSGSATLGFLTGGERVLGVLEGAWIRLERGGYVLSRWSDGEVIMLPGD